MWKLMNLSLKLISIQKVNTERWCPFTESACKMWVWPQVVMRGLNYGDLPSLLPPSSLPVRHQYCVGGRASQLTAGCVLPLLTWPRPSPDTSPPTLTVPNIILARHHLSTKMDSTRRLSFFREEQTKVLETKSPQENSSTSPIFFHLKFRHLAVVTVRS